MPRFKALGDRAIRDSVSPPVADREDDRRGEIPLVAEAHREVAQLGSIGELGGVAAAAGGCIARPRRVLTSIERQAGSQSLGPRAFIVASLAAKRAAR